MSYSSIKHFIFFIFIFFAAITGKAQVTGMGTGTQAVQASTIAGFTVPAGTNRVLVVTVSDALSIDILTANFNGTAMTERAEKNDGVAVDAIYTLSLGTSASSTTGNITVTSGEPGVTGKYITARVYQNVHQITPLTNIQSSSGGPTTTTFTIASTSGDLPIDILDTYNSTTGGTRTPGSGQTIVHSSPPIDVGGYAFYGITTKPGAASVAMSWTTNHSSFIHIAGNIQQAAGTLPLNLISFDANLLKDKVTLNWKISDAVNFSYFEIEKSSDGTNFNSIGKILFSAGTSNYQLTDDTNISSTRLYYRLKMMDTNGNFRYSDIVSVNTGYSDNIRINSLQPNPFTNMLNVNISLSRRQSVTFGLTDMAGKIIYSKKVTLPKGFSTQLLDGLQQLKNGAYVLWIADDKETISRKVIKQ